MRIAREIYDWLEQNPSSLPFNTIFNGKLRIILPFISSDLQYLKTKLEDNPKGYQVDLSNGTATEKVKTQRGDKDRVIKLGRLVQLTKDPELIDIWNKYQGSNYSIVLSRNPIDVLRMSDFDNIQSCHSAGGEYFQCAIAEAKGHGPIAYLVKTDDLSKINLEDQEVFKDIQRGIEGITPLARLRLRRFVSNTENMELAIPEDRVYGISGEVAKDFKESLRVSMHELQHTFLADSRPRISDFTRTGGYYADTPASTLFNNFFQDELDSGDSAFDGEHDIFQQYEEEVEAITREYRGVFKHRVNGDAQVEDGGGEPHVYCNGYCVIQIPGELIVNKLPGDIDSEFTKQANYKEIKQLTILINDAVNEITSSSECEDYDLQSYNGNLLISMRVKMYDPPPGPDGYKELMACLRDDWDKEYDKLTALLYQQLESYGYVKKAYSKSIPDLKWKHFTIDSEDETTKVTTSMWLYNLDKYASLTPYGRFNLESDWFSQCKYQIKQILINEEKSHQQYITNSPTLPGVQWNIPEVDFSFPEPQVDFYWSRNLDVNVSIIYTFHPIMLQNHARGMDQHITFLDKAYERLHHRFIKVFETTVVARFQALPKN